MKINKKGYCGHSMDMLRNDKRLKNYAQQRKDRGFDDTETWNLNTAIAKYISPRLDRLIEIQSEFIEPPYEEYFDDLKSLSKACKRYIDDTWDEEATSIIQTILPKVFPWLWW
ncbi:MAG: hypothetical protein A2381_19390 [Bdellovibrionales bacterium RIFOXYB1_FULL_37_110]|nr:MAG: hypothetical protein A2381_19390 [Bdellovibrionales bacterium RIFOXYB1_FULL_37_110]